MSICKLWLQNVYSIGHRCKQKIISLRGRVTDLCLATQGYGYNTYQKVNKVEEPISLKDWFYICQSQKGQDQNNNFFSEYKKMLLSRINQIYY